MLVIKGVVRRTYSSKIRIEEAFWLHDNVKLVGLAHHFVSEHRKACFLSGSIH